MCYGIFDRLFRKTTGKNDLAFYVGFLCIPIEQLLLPLEIFKRKFTSAAFTKI